MSGLGESFFSGDARALVQSGSSSKKKKRDYDPNFELQSSGFKVRVHFYLVDDDLSRQEYWLSSGFKVRAHFYLVDDDLPRQEYWLCHNRILQNF